MAKEPLNKLTLSQAVLSPVNSILKAQVHAARSFLNLITQMGFRHEESDEDDAYENSIDPSETLHYFRLKGRRFDAEGNERTYEIKIPTIAMMPLNPLAIEEANVSFSMSLSGSYTVQKQLNTKDREGQNKQFNTHNRPWYVVEDPVDLSGVISDDKDSQSTIHVNLRIGKGDVPPELKKFIASASDFSSTEIKDSY